MSGVSPYMGVRFTEHDPRIERVAESGCWVWMGTLGTKGYGRSTNGRRVGVSAHRAVWETLRGPIPEGMVLDHMCRVRPCVNPDHLRVVTPRTNVLENSLNFVAIKARLVCCERCGSDFRFDTKGKRYCYKCRLANWHKNYHKKKAEAVDD